VSNPAIANRWWPSASMSATRSAARVPRSYPSRGLSDSPIPRWSTAITSKSRASAGITSRHWYQVWGQPCTSSSGGPSPPMTACRRTSPVSTYRLVNVSLNAFGRPGAPDTEPGPSGVEGAADDECMRISLALTASVLVTPPSLVVRPECRAREDTGRTLVCTGEDPGLARRGDTYRKRVLHVTPPPFRPQAMATRSWFFRDGFGAACL
jgi:hypothetical protein